MVDIITLGPVLVLLTKELCKLLNEKVWALFSNPEPDSAPWINKNVAPVILLLVLTVSFAPEDVVVADTGNS